MAVFNRFQFGRWKFSPEVAERFKCFKESQQETNDFPENWKKVYSYLPIVEKSSYEDSREYLTDSSASTDVDDEEWEDLKMYTKQLQRMKLQSVNKDHNKADKVLLENCENLSGLIIDKDTSETTRQDDFYNVFSQMSQIWNSSGMEVEEVTTSYGIVEQLKTAIIKDNTHSEEVTTLLKSNDVSKEHLVELWNELKLNDSARIQLCTLLAEYKLRIAFLCQKLLLPWLTNNETKYLNEIVEKISDVLPKFPDVAMKHLIAPILLNGCDSNSENSNAFMRNPYLLQDIMSHLEPTHWSLLLKELLSNSEITEKCCLPLLKIVIDSSDDTVSSDNETLYKLFNLINARLSELSKDRDFGLLIISVIDCVKRTQPVSPEIVKQLECIATEYKGSMRFKISNALKQFYK